MITETIDIALFEEAKNKMMGTLPGANGIGTLSEKTVHSVLKYYFAPNEAYHEQKIGTFVADICVDGEIYEIQTKQFHLLRRKLNFFLQSHDVTVVYPISVHNKIHWIDKETGEIKPALRNPKRGNKYQILPELYKIKMFLSNPRLHFVLVMLDTEEYRILDGWSHDLKKGATKTDKQPVTLLEEIRINSIADYAVFLPDSLPDQFTSEDYAKCAKISRSLAGTGLNVLYSLGLLQRVGKVKNFYLYER